MLIPKPQLPYAKFWVWVFLLLVTRRNDKLVVAARAVLQPPSACHVVASCSGPFSHKLAEAVLRARTDRYEGHPEQVVNDGLLVKPAL